MQDVYVGSLVSEPHLYHHGILGMKWGVRRFQNKDGSYTSAGKQRYGNKRSDSKEKHKGLSDKQKTALKVGAGLVAGALLAYGGYSLAKSGKLDGLIKKGQNAVDIDRGAGGISNTALKKFGEIEGEHAWPDDLMSVNPYSGGKNCGGCSVSLLERHNNNLNMVAKNHGKMTWNDLEQVYPGLKHNPIGPLDDPRELSSYVSSHFKDGDNGILRLNAKNSSVTDDHYIVWAKENGKVIYMDGQASGKSKKMIAFDDNPKYDFLYDRYNLDTCQIAQTNNLTLTEDGAVLDKYFERGKK